AAHARMSLPPVPVDLANADPDRPIIFFFPAEDVIRGFHVTGVQTCALPICLHGEGLSTRSADGRIHIVHGLFWSSREPRDTRTRSEERRVGEESRWRSTP